MGIKVVLKQYNGESFNEMINEVKIFTQIEKARMSQAKDQKYADIYTKGSKHDGLSQLLGYKIKEGHGEILMTHSGSTLDKWSVKLLTKK